MLVESLEMAFSRYIVPGTSVSAVILTVVLFLRHTKDLISEHRAEMLALIVDFRESLKQITEEHARSHSELNGRIDRIRGLER